MQIRKPGVGCYPLELHDQNPRFVLLPAVRGGLGEFADQQAADEGVVSDIGRIEDAPKLPVGVGVASPRQVGDATRLLNERQHRRHAELHEDRFGLRRKRFGRFLLPTHRVKRCP